MEPVKPNREFIDERIRVALVGTERVTRAGLRMLIDSHQGLRVVAEVECAEDLTALPSAAQPQVAVVDLDGGLGANVIPDLREAGPSDTRIIVLTSAPDSPAWSNAIQLGVAGIVSKQQAPDILIRAIERVHAGEVWLNRANIAGVLGRLRNATQETRRHAGRPDALVPRERQIITLVGHGFRNNEIATSIFVSEATVRNCLAAIFRKLGISNRVHLMIYAIQEGFVNLSISDTPSTTASTRDLLRLATNAGQPIRQRSQS
jgi:two-component system, NarL family, nitrate/nitrite response regulator NarL